jgi:hypothetical protein
VPQPAGSFGNEQKEYRILMDSWPTAKNKANTTHGNTKGALNTRLSCMQINLQHARPATDNLLKIMDEEKTDIICIQEPYISGSKIIEIPRSCTVLVASEGKKRTAIVINNKHVDAILITQLSDEDATIMEARVGSVTFVTASMYNDIKRSIEEELEKYASSTDTCKRHRDDLRDRQQCWIHNMARCTD